MVTNCIVVSNRTELRVVAMSHLRMHVRVLYILCMYSAPTGAKILSHDAPLTGIYKDHCSFTEGRQKMLMYTINAVTARTVANQTLHFSTLTSNITVTRVSLKRL